MAMFIVYLPIAVFSFSEKLRSLALASKVRISLHFSDLCTLYFKKKTRMPRLSFAINAILNLSNIQDKLSSLSQGVPKALH